MPQKANGKGITLATLMTGLMNWANVYTPQGIAITKFICEELIPHCNITKEEAGAALKQLNGISCSHMVIGHIWPLKAKFESIIKSPAAI